MLPGTPISWLNGRPTTNGNCGSGLRASVGAGASGPRRWWRSSKPNSIACWLTCAGRWSGAIASAPTNLSEGFFRHLRRYLSRFPGCQDAAHSEQVLGCYVLAAEQMNA